MKATGPDGLVTHSAGLDANSHLVVIEVWDTPGHQARFTEERLGEALGLGGVTGPPSSATWTELLHTTIPAEPTPRSSPFAWGWR